MIVSAAPLQARDHGDGHTHVKFQTLPRTLDVDGLLEGFLNPLPEEAPKVHGDLYELTPSQPDGQWQVLKWRGETRPDGHDIPAANVVNNRVVIGVEGIDSDPSYYTRTFTHLLEHDGPATHNLGQPILMVHEGVDKNLASSIGRMAYDLLQCKSIESGHRPDTRAIFAHDPAVQTTFNLLKQALDGGHQVLLLAHSGGGTVTALALNVLANVQHGKYRNLIHSQVRELSFAGFAAYPDYVDAGVDPANMLYVGDRHDAVAVAGSTYIDPHNVAGGMQKMWANVQQAGIDFSLGKVHDVNTIWPENQAHVLSFLNGGPGGVQLS